MTMRNRLTLRADPCSTPFSMILDEERWFAILTWMVLVWRKFLVKLKMLFLISCIFRIRCLHTILYAFSMSRYTTVVVGWQRLPVSRFLSWLSDRRWNGIAESRFRIWWSSDASRATTVGDDLPSFALAYTLCSSMKLVGNYWDRWDFFIWF